MGKRNKIKVACIGDSITTGYGLSCPKNESYPAVLQSLLGNRYDVKGFGVNGSTVLRTVPLSYAITEECEAALDYCADIVIIELGANDLLYIPGMEHEFVRDYNCLLDAILVDSPKARIFITSLTPIVRVSGFTFEEIQKRQEQIQELIKGIASYHDIQLIDLWSPLKEALGSQSLLFPDGVHPNLKGTEMIANAVYSIIGDIETDSMTYNNGGDS